MADDTPQYLREKAAQCRSALRWITEEKSVRVLRDMADELDAKATALEAEATIATRIDMVEQQKPRTTGTA